VQSWRLALKLAGFDVQVRCTACLKWPTDLETV
jgi:hypothetical protein